VEHIIIIGKTIDGAVFRPRNWTTRIAVSVFGKNKRLQYHKHISPVWVDSENVAGLRVNKVLQTEEPLLYNHLMGFANSNNLAIDYGKEIIKEKDRSVGSFKERDTATA